MFFMNRIIKFRGKSKYNDQWVYGYYFKTDRCFVGEYNEEVEVEPESVGQFTGQVFNKVELYEGDIVEVEYHEWVNTRVINPFNEDETKLIIRLICRFGVDSSFHLNRIDDGSHACYSVQFSGSAVKRKEIIGNKTDNPELLNAASATTSNSNMNIDPHDLQPASEEVKEVEAQPAEQATTTESAEEGQAEG